MTQFVWLWGGCFITVHACVSVRMRVYVYWLSFIYALLSNQLNSISHDPQSAPNSTGQVEVVFLKSGKPQAGNLSNTHPAVCFVIGQKCQHHLSVGPRHTLEENIWPGTQTVRQKPRDLFSSCFYSWALKYVTLFPKQPLLIIWGRGGEGGGWLMKCP